eukprot:CAMPEP_0168618386 /NCGR_PEP_ID=MMETSP0449_2-20121227/6046_1 /TAXON_ID=1082188 /ORGANISM="Strombidium rassoulzadegani, Strain ras09" /LENGTH=116 /DNA_ID=CAMNT_0008659261 /DNA_START=248 /DNA_END=595 /DNA_ORIENTATION=-
MDSQGDPTLSMMSKMKAQCLSDEEVESCGELMATSFLNMAICHHILKNYERAVQNCERSLSLKKSIKAYYRLGQGLKQLKNYEGSIKAFKQAILMDTSDPNDIQTELQVVERLEKA